MFRRSRVAPVTRATACALAALALSAHASIAPDPSPSGTPANPAKSADSAKPADAQNPAPSPAPTPAVPFPHPLITEVLYDVPTGIEGDASGDGVRQVAGDEFVELVNPHDKPIQLLGYSLIDESQSEKSRVRFTFPPLELPPAGVAVVFNGYGVSWSGPVGDQTSAGKPFERFHNARVFTMRITAPRIAFNNTGDSVTLLTPAAKPVQCVRWGTSAAPKSDLPGVLDETVPETSKCSVQRLGVLPGNAWLVHTSFGGAPFSPGRYDINAAHAPPRTPADAPPPSPPADPDRPNLPSSDPNKK